MRLRPGDRVKAWKRDVFEADSFRRFVGVEAMLRQSSLKWLPRGQAVKIGAMMMLASTCLSLMEEREPEEVESTSRGKDVSEASKPQGT